LIVNEYGSVLPLLEFIKLVNRKQRKENKSMYNWLRENESDENYRNGAFRDREGFDFNFRDFS
jgi:hypothetical protein